MSEKKIVIKINYGAERSGEVAALNNEPTQITEWNLKRIFTGLAVLVLAVGVLIYSTVGEEEEFTEVQGYTESIPLAIEPKSPKRTDQLRGSESSAARSQQRIEIQTAEREHDPVSVLETERETLPRKKSISGFDVSKFEPVDTQEATTESKTSAQNDKIIRSQFTSNIKHREPVDKMVPPFFAQPDKAIGVHYFTELKGLKGHTITHSWKHEGRVVSERPFKVRGNRWRIYTSKLLNMKSLGQWEVRVVDSNGDIIDQKNFELKTPAG